METTTITNNPVSFNPMLEYTTFIQIHGESVAVVNKGDEECLNRYHIVWMGREGMLGYDSVYPQVADALASQLYDTEQEAKDAFVEAYMASGELSFLDSSQYNSRVICYRGKRVILVSQDKDSGYYSALLLKFVGVPETKLAEIKATSFGELHYAVEYAVEQWHLLKKYYNGE